MMRRNGLGFWATVVVLVATFAAEPSASARVSIQLFEGIGEFGGAVVSELASPEEPTN